MNRLAKKFRNRRSLRQKSKLKFMQINKVLYRSIQTLIKNVFLLNFAHELLMSFLRFDIRMVYYLKRTHSRTRLMSFRLN